jgi:hypothetical protein
MHGIDLSRRKIEIGIAIGVFLAASLGAATVLASAVDLAPNPRQAAILSIDADGVDRNLNTLNIPKSSWLDNGLCRQFLYSRGKPKTILESLIALQRHLRTGSALCESFYSSENLVGTFGGAINVVKPNLLIMLGDAENPLSDRVEIDIEPKGSASQKLRIHGELWPAYRPDFLIISDVIKIFGAPSQVQKINFDNSRGLLKNIAVKGFGDILYIYDYGNAEVISRIECVSNTNGRIGSIRFFEDAR